LLFRRCVYCRSYASVVCFCEHCALPLCMDCSRSLRVLPGDVRYVCSVLFCPGEAEFLALVKNGDVGMMSLCRRHLVEVRSQGDFVAVVSRRLEVRELRVSRRALEELHGCLQ
jgi:hypothetical protein